jgi:hypothetical protein
VTLYRSIASGDHPVKGVLQNARGQLTGHSASVGVPNALKIVLSCSKSLSPAMYGTLNINSAKMQPAAQLSTPVL